MKLAAHQGHVQKSSPHGPRAVSNFVLDWRHTKLQVLCSILAKQRQHFHHQILVCLQSQGSCPQRRPKHLQGGPVLSRRAWGPTLVGAQSIPQHLTQQRQQKLTAMKWLSCPRSELSPFQQHPMPGSPTSSLSSFPARQQPTSSLPCCLEVSDSVVKCEGDQKSWLG